MRSNSSHHTSPRDNHHRSNNKFDFSRITVNPLKPPDTDKVGSSTSSAETDGKMQRQVAWQRMSAPSPADQPLLSSLSRVTEVSENDPVDDF